MKCYRGTLNTLVSLWAEPVYRISVITGYRSPRKCNPKRRGIRVINFHSARFFVL